MKSLFSKLVIKSMIRRYKEMRKVIIITFIAVFFIAATLVFQDNINNYLMESNYIHYGDWILSDKVEASTTTPSLVKHPYFSSYGTMTVGMQLIDKNTSDSLKYYLGSCDSKLEDFGNIRLYEGKMPVKANEVAMELDLLAKLGYDYEIGQTVTVHYLDKENQLCTREYQLCGTLVNYTSAWVKGDSMPAALVASGSILPEDSLYSIYYYHLNKKYKDIDGSDFSKSMMQQETGKTLNYNKFVYDNRFWGTKKTYNSIVILFMGIGIASLTYLLISYFNQRRPFYFKIRCFGASKWQIRKMSVLECLIGCIPAIALSIVAAYLTGGLLTGLLSFSYHMNYFYEMNIVTFIKILASCLLTVFVAILILQLNIRSDKLSENTYEIPLKKLKKLPKDSHSFKKMKNALIKRQNKAFLLRGRVYRILSIGVLAVLLFCLTELYNADRTFQNVMDFFECDYKAVIDYSGTESYDYNFNGETGNMTIYYVSCYDGFDNEFCKKVKSIYGIQSVSANIEDGGHIFDWQGKEDSIIREDYQAGKGVTIDNTRFYPKDGLIYDYSSVFIKNTKQLYQEIKDYIGSDAFDYSAFSNGEQIILLIENDPFNQEDKKKENTIFPGDEINIRTQNGPLKLIVGDIIYNDEISFLSPLKCKGLYTLVGTEKIAENMAQMEGKILQPTILKIKFNSFASYEATNKQLTSLFTSKQNVSYESYMDEIKLAKTNYLQALCLYGVFFLMILLIYIVLLRNMIQSIFQYRKKSIKLLKNLGMGVGFYQRLVIREGIREGLWCFPAIIICAFFKWYFLVKSYSPVGDGIYYVKILGRYTHNMYLAYFLDLHTFFPFLWSILMFVLWVAIVAGQYYLAYRSLQIEEKTGKSKE